MQRTSFDWKTFALIVGAAVGGALWANYNRSIVTFPYNEAEYRPLVWIIFATPLAMFLGWLIARPRERWWAAFVSFCVYYFSVFVAARYESCTVVNGVFSPVSCFTQTAEAQELANNNGHVIYFGAVIVVNLVAALAVALHRARNRSTIHLSVSATPNQSEIDIRGSQP